MNLFIFSFKRLMALWVGNSRSPSATWHTFLRTTLLTFSGGVVAVYAFIVIRIQHLPEMQLLIAPLLVPQQHGS